MTTLPASPSGPSASPPTGASVRALKGIQTLPRPQPMHNLRDFRPDLRTAIDHLHEAGFDGEAYVLTAALEGAYASAHEMLSAIGSAVLRVERGMGPALPSEVKAAFQRALLEVRKALPLLN